MSKITVLLLRYAGLSFNNSQKVRVSCSGLSDGILRVIGTRRLRQVLEPIVKGVAIYFYIHAVRWIRPAPQLQSVDPVSIAKKKFRIALAAIRRRQSSVSRNPMIAKLVPCTGH